MPGRFTAAGCPCSRLLARASLVTFSVPDAWQRALAAMPTNSRLRQDQTSAETLVSTGTQNYLIYAHSASADIERANTRRLGGDARLICVQGRLRTVSSNDRWSAGMMLSGQALAMTLGPVDRPHWWRAAAPVPVAVRQRVRRSRVAGAGAQLLGVAGWVWHRRGAQPGGSRLGMREPGCTSGSSPTRTFHTMHGQPGGSTGSTTLSPAHGRRASAPRSWGGASSAHTVARGRTRVERLVGRQPAVHTPVFVLTHHHRPAVRR